VAWDNARGGKGGGGKILFILSSSSYFLTILFILSTSLNVCGPSPAPSPSPSSSLPRTAPPKVNELEMAVWTLYLNHVGWFDPSMQPLESLAMSAFAAKSRFCGDRSDMLLPYLNVQWKGFSDRYNRWLMYNGVAKVAIPPLELNRVFNLLSLPAVPPPPPQVQPPLSDSQGGASAAVGVGQSVRRSAGRHVGKAATNGAADGDVYAAAEASETDQPTSCARRKSPAASAKRPRNGQAKIL
jgi:hypothetical protein